MKKMRKIIPAFAMLLVSAIMMSTASFAWFTMNQNVTATGMQVTAKSTGGLMIATNANEYGTPDDSKFADSVVLSTGWNNGAAKINPVSRGLTDANGWYTAEAASSTSFEKTGNYTQVTTGYQNYFYKTAMYVKTLDESDTSVAPCNLFLKAITVEYTGTESNLNQSLRIALRVMDMTTANDGGDPAVDAKGVWYFFAPLRQSITNKYVADGTATSYVTGTDNIYGYTSADADGKTYNFNNIDIGNLVFNDAVRIEVYVYFEGEDAACTSQNAQILNTLTVGLKLGND